MVGPSVRRHRVQRIVAPWQLDGSGFRFSVRILIHSLWRVERQTRGRDLLEPESMKPGVVKSDFHGLSPLASGSRRHGDLTLFRLYRVRANLKPPEGERLATQLWTHHAAITPIVNLELARNNRVRGNGQGRNVTPASTLMVWAVMKLPSSESSRALNAAMSSGVPKRDLIIWRARACSTTPSGIGCSSNL